MAIWTVSTKLLVIKYVLMCEFICFFPPSESELHYVKDGNSMTTEVIYNCNVLSVRKYFLFPYVNACLMKMPVSHFLLG